MFSQDPDRLRPLMEQLERPAYFVDKAGTVRFSNAAAEEEGSPHAIDPTRVTLRVPHANGELVICQPAVAFPQYFLKQVILDSPDGVMICENWPTPAGLTRPIVFANQTMAEISGYEIREMLGKTPNLLRGPGSEPEAAALIDSAIGAGKSVVTEITHYRKDGTPYLARVTVFPLLVSGRSITHWVSVHRDVTQMRHQERLFHDAQRLESLGMLAGGIAHDFNNLLTTIMGNALMLESLMVGRAEAEILRNITAAGSTAARLCRQLLAYAGKAGSAMQAVNLTSLVDETYHVIRSSLESHITIVPEFSPNLPFIEGDPTQLQQVILNLLLNARDALEAKPGEIRLRTDAVDLASPLEGSKINGTVPPGHWVQLVVSDTGCGMTPAVLARLFEPFFTTKKEGHGLGMPAILGIVRQHRGHIRCESEPGRGTTFEIYLPVSATTADLRAPDTRPTAPSQGGLALIVDDDKLVRSGIAATLKNLGFESLMATDGTDGIRQFESNLKRINLVVIDYSMPEMDGLQALAAMRKIATVPTIVVTGFEPQRIEGKLPPEFAASVAFLGKPFGVPQLRQAVARILPAAKS